ncbi:hypothetical protein CANCADRAFT_122521 [Tortispora caseinolytica NRRL Y-17796]|uniref:Large ribosomal subunit protein bL21m n=1 Tax=Tortispora caseinolytica NRRL Y-17796 TaxID=767744 RepID=A0A1E4THT6_9ASCO|nr:hypothetical protein CANCADRAFT_122521 [Tortispora caseinolytica NRRL Y-17796]
MLRSSFLQNGKLFGARRLLGTLASVPRLNPDSLTKTADVGRLKSAPSLYAAVHIYKQRFLVTPGDQLTLPFRLTNVKLGDRLKLNRLTQVGSQDYVLQGDPFIDPSKAWLEATVIEETKEPFRVLTKKKQRNRKVSHIASKHVYTVLRIGDLHLN